MCIAATIAHTLRISSVSLRRHHIGDIIDILVEIPLRIIFSSALEA